MDYVSALVPPLVMAVGFTFLVVTIIKNQGGANRAKEDAAVDAAIAARTVAQPRTATASMPSPVVPGQATSAESSS